MDDRGLGTSYRQANQIFLNRGDGTFREVSRQAGPGMTVVESSRGAAFGDLDGDGDPDVIVVNMDARPTLLRNDRLTSNGWVGLALRGVGANRDAVGARVWLSGGDRRQVREVRAGSGYLSRDDPRPLFGLGTVARAAWVEIRWPGGARSRHGPLPVGAYYHLSQPDPEEGRAGGGGR